VRAASTALAARPMSAGNTATPTMKTASRATSGDDGRHPLLIGCKGGAPRETGRPLFADLRAKTV
jgi:hypothetical protein